MPRLSVTRSTFAGAIKLHAQGVSRLIASFGAQFGLEDFIDEGGDGHHEEFEHDHTMFLSTGSLPQPDMCVVFRSPVPPAGASDVVGWLEHERKIEKLRAGSRLSCFSRWEVMRKV